MQDLFKRYLQNQCSPEEVKEMLKWFDVAENEENELLLRALIAESLEDVDGDGNEVRWAPAFDAAFVPIKKRPKRQMVKPVPQTNRTWFRLMAAVVFLVVARSI